MGAFTERKRGRESLLHNFTGHGRKKTGAFLAGDGGIGVGVSSAAYLGIKFASSFGRGESTDSIFAKLDLAHPPLRMVCTVLYTLCFYFKEEAVPKKSKIPPPPKRPCNCNKLSSDAMRILGHTRSYKKKEDNSFSLNFSASRGLFDPLWQRSRGRAEQRGKRAIFGGDFSLLSCLGLAWRYQRGSTYSTNGRREGMHACDTKAGLAVSYRWSGRTLKYVRRK